jgi:diguanylate cyclase (GGDEF)-like protein
VKVLIAEDSIVSSHLLFATLRTWGFDVVVARDGDQAWRELQKEDAPRLAILDWEMPGLTGPEVCRLVREQPDRQYSYLLLLTSRNGKQDLVEGMEAGADDYVTKPFDRNELKARIRAGKRILDLQAELLEAREALREQAMRDALTGLWNRRAILEAFDRELSRSRREAFPLGVVMVDLDHFKTINDTCGHQAGDQVLQAAAGRIRAAVRSYDSVGRCGGEEFLIILPGCDEESVMVHAERMRQELERQPLATERMSFNVTASIGVTTADPGLDLEGEHFIRVADDALYEAKRGGRNRACYLPASPVAV